MKTRPASAALAAVVALLAAAPAAADAVRKQQLDEAANARPASGFSISVSGDNLKRTSDLNLELRWGYDSSWNRYSYVENNPIKLLDPDGRAVLEFQGSFKNNAETRLAINSWFAKGGVAGEVAGVVADFFLADVLPQSEPELEAAVNNMAAGFVAGMVKLPVVKGKALPTSRAARREAMRDAGTPTSRAATSQSGTGGARQTIVEGADGKPRVQTLHSADAKHPNPHWHDAGPKIDPATGKLRTNQHGQVREMSQGRTTVEIVTKD